jgi:hypothetical protein
MSRSNTAIIGIANYAHADVQELVEHGLVEKDEQGRVFVPWDDIVVDVEPRCWTPPEPSRRRA